MYESSLTHLEFASCLAYSPAGAGPLCGLGRSLCAQLKAAEPGLLMRSSALVWQQWRAHGCFSTIFAPGVVLIPVPGSQRVPRGPWVSERLAWCLGELGLAQTVWPALRRRHGVRKSAFAAVGARPSVLEHFESFALDPASMIGHPLLSGMSGRIVLIDDVITRGRTLLAAALRLRSALPRCEIRGFALLRTLDRREQLERIVEPCEGEVRWLRGDARRVP